MPLLRAAGEDGGDDLDSDGESDEEGGGGTMNTNVDEYLQVHPEVMDLVVKLGTYQCRQPASHNKKRRVDHQQHLGIMDGIAVPGEGIGDGSGMHTGMDGAPLVEDNAEPAADVVVDSSGGVIHGGAVDAAHMHDVMHAAVVAAAAEHGGEGGGMLVPEMGHDTSVVVQEQRPPRSLYSTEQRTALLSLYDFCGR